MKITQYEFDYFETKQFVESFDGYISEMLKRDFDLTWNDEADKASSYPWCMPWLLNIELKGRSIDCMAYKWACDCVDEIARQIKEFGSCQEEA